MNLKPLQELFFALPSVAESQGEVAAYEHFQNELLTLSRAREALNQFDEDLWRRRFQELFHPSILESAFCEWV